MFTKRKILFVIIVLVFFGICNAVYARYVLNRKCNVKISSVPFYLEAEIDSSIIFNDGENTNLVIKNNDGTQYNSMPSTYQISIEGNDKFNFSIDNETAVDNVIEKTIDGGSIINNSFNIKFIADIDELNAKENVIVKIISTEPYAKKIEVPISIELKQTTVTLDANGGTVNPSTIVVNKNETYADLPTPVWYGHVFEGWYSAKEGGTKYETTTKVTTDASTQTLYARWTSLLLADNAKIGDYVNYGVSYSNVYTGNSGTTHMPEDDYTGWRVIGFATDSNGDKYVKLVTAGIPLSYVHPKTTTTSAGAKSVTALTTDFFNTKINSTSTEYTYHLCGFSNSTTKISQNLFKNDYTQTTSAGVPGVQAMTKDDLDKALYLINGTGPTGNGDPVYKDEIGSDLLAIPSGDAYAAYYLATYVTESPMYLWNVRYLGSVVYTYNEYGVRPVVSLKATVMGEKVNNVWQLSVGE